MLKLTDIKKTYETGSQKVEALKGVSIDFRKSEFVAILGQSGCGKTTLLNIIGGLDHMTSGDLVIKGRSTKKYSDRDWDTYRNHSVGFVFQSYNLIPHQTVLANIELALTLSGVKKAERKRRALEALEKVGLAGQEYKKPNQLSGGQMQRVAIARAIVNDPEILLADEPTGALDSETSVQVMDILKEIAKDRLVIMVTHNPELASVYASRIIKLKDGKVIDDTMPYHGEDGENTSSVKKNRSMSFFTALGLSMNNLMTKKGRTIMTCFAGSIGIIGIALILSVSNGVNNFIDRIQENTLSEYPLTVSEEQVDLSSMLSVSDDGDESERTDRKEGYVYESAGIQKIMKAMTSVTTTKNNVKDFKKFIETNEEFQSLASSVQYSYDVNMDIYYKNSDGKIVKSDSETVLKNMYKSMGVEISGAYGSLFSSFTSQMNVWVELMPGKGDAPVSEAFTNQFDILAGHWPENKNEVVLILSNSGELSDFVLYALGLKSSEEFDKLVEDAMSGNTVEISNNSWSYEELMSLDFRLILSVNKYAKQSDGTYTDLTATDTGLALLYSDADKYEEIKISGIVIANDDGYYSSSTGGIGYTSLLTDYIIEETANSEIVKAQLADPSTDVITGLMFPSDGDSSGTEKKADAVRKLAEKMTVTERAALYISIASVPDDDYVSKTADEILAAMGRDAVISEILASYGETGGTMDIETVKAYLNAMSDEDVFAMAKSEIEERVKAEYAEEVKEKLAGYTEEELSEMLDKAEFSDEAAASLYDTYFAGSLSESTYDENIALFGYVDRDVPSTITVYASTFADKNRISEIVDEYNESVEEEDRIKMTDYVKLIMSSVTTVIDAISYVLIAFVAISLIVSSIMIGVITNISVLERTKEIGILRAVGASKGDVSRVFNAETFVIGLLSGVLGIGVSLVLIVPINIILHELTGLSYLSAALPADSAAVLILLSMALTIVAGLIPSRGASKKDPVEALRSE